VRGGRTRGARCRARWRRRSSRADQARAGVRGSARRRAGRRRTARRPRSRPRSRAPPRASGPRSALARRVEVEGQRLRALLAAVVRRLHRDLLAALALLERTAYVEAELELRRRVQERFRGREPEHADEVVVEAIEAIAI